MGFEPTRPYSQVFKVGGGGLDTSPLVPSSFGAEVVKTCIKLWTLNKRQNTSEELIPVVLVQRGGVEPPRSFNQRIFLPTTVFTATVNVFVVWTLSLPFP